jgi:hypothetical protein
MERTASSEVERTGKDEWLACSRQAQPAMGSLSSRSAASPVHPKRPAKSHPKQVISIVICEKKNYVHS